MIDPANITNFKLSDEALEEHILFWVAVAGKNASNTSRALNSFLDHLYDRCPGAVGPFDAIRMYGKRWLSHTLKKHGIGCYTHRAKAFWELANSNLNLRTCSVEDLEKIHGIGPKTSRCFIMHSRHNANVAGLDVHILRYMRDQGIKVPRSTPTGKKYLELEREFLRLVPKGISVAEFDLSIWRTYSGRVA